MEKTHEPDKVKAKEKKVTLLEFVRDKAESDLYIVNTREEFTDTIKDSDGEMEILV